jgi:hypothetical protein
MLPMSSTTTSLVVLACLCGGALAGMLLRGALPRHHLDEASKAMVLLGTGLVVTMSALVLGLLVSAAHTSFEAQSVELTDLSAKIVFLDRLLAHYGPEAKGARDLLRSVATRAAERFSSERSEMPPLSGEDLFAAIVKLTPKDDTQRVTRDEALRLVSQVGQTRWLVYAQRHTSLPKPLLIVVVAWLTLVFVSFGLFAPTNGVVRASLFCSALSVSGAVFLILELYSPFEGMLRLSSEPLRVALQQLGR